MVRSGLRTVMAVGGSVLVSLVLIGASARESRSATIARPPAPVATARVVRDASIPDPFDVLAVPNTRFDLRVDAADVGRVLAVERLRAADGTPLAQVRITRPFTNDTFFVAWKIGSADAGTAGRTVVVHVLAADGSPAGDLILYGATVTKYVGPDLSARTSEIAKESVEIVYTRAVRR